MPQNNLFGLFLATAVASDLAEIIERCREVSEPLLEEVNEAIVKFLTQPITPDAAFELETTLQDRLREAGRRTLEVVFNGIEPDNPQSAPQRVVLENQEYTRKNRKTNNRGGIGTLFGQIMLLRFSYEPLQEARDDGQKSFSPLEMLLGIVAGSATAALAERVGREAAEHTQEELLALLRREHHVDWSVTVLRNVTKAVSEGVAEHVHDAQKAQLLGWLKEAGESKGRRKIVLAVGRDGIMLPIRGEATYKEGAVATVAVYNRRGRRLGTVYLGQMPEAYQLKLSAQLTRLVSEVLGEWDGPWPRLVYVTDAGYHPTEYFENELKKLEHPRHPGKPMDWTWIVDFYHASEYISKLARLLFDDPRAANAWSRRMRHCLKHKPRAVFRILHSAAKLHSQWIFTAKEEQAYQSAYNYLLWHKDHMDYSFCRRMGLPIGSGVTEAGCKTVFTQRFKESGMSWGLEGGHVILTLRLARLSQIWDTVYREYLAHQTLPTLPTQHHFAPANGKKAA
jgi:hypothetical protein